MPPSDGGLSWRDVAPGTLWRLLELAFELAPQRDWDLNADLASVCDSSPSTLLGLLYGRLLELRIATGLSQAYESAERALSTVRGRPMLVESSRLGIAQRGRLLCRFDELTVDRPRNRQLKCAAQLLLNRVNSGSPESAVVTDRLHWCIDHMRGVRDVPADALSLGSEAVGRHELQDAPVVHMALLVLQFLSGSNEQGATLLPEVDLDNRLMRKVFERAVFQHYRLTLDPTTWEVDGQGIYAWTGPSSMSSFLPVLKPDVVLRRRDGTRTIIVETKFTKHLAQPHYAGGSTAPKLHSAHLYQLFSYAKSQSWTGSVTGVLVYPRSDDLGADDIAFEVAGVAMRAVTIELRSAASWASAVGLLAGVVS